VINKKKQLFHQVPEIRGTKTSGKSVVYRKKGTAFDGYRQIIIREQHHTSWYWKSFSRTCCLLRDPSISLYTASTFTFFRTVILCHRDHTVRQ